MQDISQKRHIALASNINAHHKDKYYDNSEIL